MARQPVQTLRMLVGAVVVEDDMYDLAYRNLMFDLVQEPDELLMPVALHVSSGPDPSRTSSAANRGVVPLRL